MERDVFLDFLNEMNPPPKPPAGRDKPDLPEPSTMLLLGSRLIGLAGYGRKKLF
jgi:hypothetical protein